MVLVHVLFDVPWPLMIQQTNPFSRSLASCMQLLLITPFMSEACLFVDVSCNLLLFVLCMLSLPCVRIVRTAAKLGVHAREDERCQVTFCSHMFG